jgi:hypothetical protein
LWNSGRRVEVTRRTAVSSRDGGLLLGLVVVVMVAKTKLGRGVLREVRLGYEGLGLASERKGA